MVSGNETAVEQCLLVDRPRLRRLEQRLKQDKAHSDDRLMFARMLGEASARVSQREAVRPAVTYPEGLPIVERRDELVRLIGDNRVLVLCGETGSGKSTQLPKLCLEAGRGRYGRIGHTQPRRIAARSLANRIAAELGQPVGSGVGYKVRFRDHVADETLIKLMTDGMLLAEVRSDRELLEYDTLIIDEAHERSLNIDFLLGYLKQLLKRRTDLHVIITSATIDPQRFAEHFDNAPIVEVSGRTFPVEVRYRVPEEPGAGERDETMQQAIVDAIDELQREGSGDVLVFLSGEREIRETAETLRKHKLMHAEVVPLYARLSPAEQAKVFAPSGRQRIVLATNVAETSLTVPGIRYVVDVGFARISRYSARSKIQRLPVERISQASAEQRKGRCGRVADGICIRLYDEDDFAARPVYTEPEIQRTNLAAVILQMATLGFGEVERFPFVDPPDSRLVRDGYKLLEELAAVDRQRKVTRLGRALAKLPVDPRIGRMLLAAARSACLDETLIIAAALSVQDPRDRPADKRQEADEAHAQFADERSDFVGLLNLWRFLEENRRHLTRRKFERLCRQHFLAPTRVREWHDVVVQLRLQMHDLGHRENTEPADYATLHRSLLTGLLSQVGLRGQGKERDYLGARNRRFHVFPGSALFQKQPKWVMAAELVETTRLYARSVAAIEPEWIEPLAGHLVKHSYSSPRWQGKRGQVAADEKVTLYGLPIVPRRRVNFGPIDPAVSRELFLRHGLTEGDMTTRAPFWRHNQSLIADLRDLEAKERRRDVLVDEEVIYAFYAARVPDGLYSTAQLESWLRKLPQAQRKQLHMRVEDIVKGRPGDDSAERFPDSLLLNDSRLPLSYHFAPGEENDGVTLSVPVSMIGQVTEGIADRLVPGLLQEKVTALLKGLPKGLRRQLVPIPETVERCLQALPQSDEPLVRSLAQLLKHERDLLIPEDAWDTEALPDHLRLRVRVLDQDGRKTIATSRNLAELHHRFAGSSVAATPVALDDGEQRLLDWTCGPLPRESEQKIGRLQMRTFPALIDGGDHVSVKSIDNLASAQRAHRAGLRRLLILTEAKALRALKKNISGLKTMQLHFAKVPLPPGSANDTSRPLADQLVELAVDEVFLDNPWSVRDADAFRQLRDSRRQRLGPALIDAGKRVAEILERAHSARSALTKLVQPNWQASVADMRQQLNGLIYQGFLQDIDPSQLTHLPRYLEALQRRIDRLGLDARRDRQRLEELTELQQLWAGRWEKAMALGQRDARLEEIRWLLEELRVSLFAQELKTPQPVSVKRIRKRWDALGL
jgi:ATP-dependent helicase HrpA